MQDSKSAAENRVELVTLLKNHRTLITCLWIGSLTLIAALPSFRAFKFFYAIEQSSLSLRLLLRGYEAPKDDEPKIVLVAVDDRSLNPVFSEEDLDRYPDLELMLDPWPWDRATHAIIAERLIEAGAQAVAFDFIFPTPNPGNADFLEVIEKYPNQIVLGYNYVPIENELGETQVQESLPYDELLPEDAQNLLGFVNIERDPDGTLRRAKLTTNLYAENQVFIDDPEAYARLSQLSQRTISELALSARLATQAGSQSPYLKTALFDYPTINYGGIAGYFPTVSYIDIILDDRFEAQREIFQDALVIAGPFSDFFKDVVPTPFGDMYGLETHAHVLRSIVTDSFYKVPKDHYLWAMLAAFSALLVAGNLRIKAALKKGAWILGLLIGYLALTQACFEWYRWVLPVMPILWVAIPGSGVMLVFDFVIDQYERHRLRGYLNRYVSPEVARILVENPDGFRQLLKGANRPIAVLFSDIRGFTTLSEQYSPQGLVNHLNEYFQSMVDSILDRRGSLNKYVGDAILAVWGDVYSAGPEKDCLGAVSSAMDMVDRLETLNDQWQGRDDRIPLKIGIGISYGEGFVGNMGHSNRMEVAVMGDVVNLGSRLEGATKQYGCSILVSGDVFQQTYSAFHYQELDVIQVKGKTEGIRVYTPLYPIEEPKPDWLPKWQSALALYRSRKFNLALEIFSELVHKSQRIETACLMYIDRCKQLQSDPPPEDWNYVYVMTSK